DVATRRRTTCGSRPRSPVPRADPHDMTAAADRTVAAFLRQPAAFDPARGSLPAFLRLAARRDLPNLIRGGDRHHLGRIPWEGVELVHSAGNEPEEVESPADHRDLRAAVEVVPAAPPAEPFVERSKKSRRVRVELPASRGNNR